MAGGMLPASRGFSIGNETPLNKAVLHPDGTVIYWKPVRRAAFTDGRRRVRRSKYYELAVPELNSRQANEILAKYVRAKVDGEFKVKKRKDGVIFSTGDEFSHDDKAKFNRHCFMLQRHQRTEKF